MEEPNNETTQQQSEQQQAGAAPAPPPPLLRIGAKKITLILDEDVELSNVVASLRDMDCVVLYLNIYKSFVQRYTIDRISSAFYYARLPHLLGIKVECPECRNNRLQQQQQEHPTAAAADESSSFSFPVKALSSILQKSIKLEYIIFNVKLVGTRNDFDAFGKAVGRMNSIQCVGFTINVEELPMAANANHQDAAAAAPPPAAADQQQHQENNNNNLLDPLLQALSKKTTLTDVIIKGGVSNPIEASLGSIRSESLCDLCRLPKLTCLYLFLFVLSNENVTSLAKALEGNHLLKEICINCSLSRSGSEAFARMLRINKSLKEVILIISNYDTPNNSNNNTTAEQVDEAIIRGVSDSSSLKEFLFQGGNGNISLKSLQLFRDVLKTNYVLEKVCLRVGPSQTNQNLENEMNFYLDLNKSGRGKLLRDDSVFRDDRWVRMLANCCTSTTSTTEATTINNNLPKFHYFLSNHPSLICHHPAALPKTKTTCKSSTTTTTSKVAKYSRKRKRLYRAAKYKGVCYS